MKRTKTFKKNEILGDSILEFMSKTLVNTYEEVYIKGLLIPEIKLKNKIKITIEISE